MSAQSKYHGNLSNPATPGAGENFNPSWLPSTAILGVMAGIDPQQIFSDIRRVTPAGNRPVPAARFALPESFSTFCPVSHPGCYEFYGVAANHF